MKLYICAVFHPIPWCLNHPQPTFYMLIRGMFGIINTLSTIFKLQHENRYCHSALGGGAAPSPQAPSRFFIQVQFCALAIRFSAYIYMFFHVFRYVLYDFICVYMFLSFSLSTYIYIYTSN